MPLATVLVGLAAGGVGMLLTLLLHAVQHLAFGYTENTFLRGVERASAARRVLATGVGGVVVGLGWWWHRQRVDAETVSVTRALRDADHDLPVPATVLDAAFQVIAVGVGGSLGREGAPRQAAAALASWLGGRLRLAEDQRRTLLACGAGAGLAAVYNVPAGGALFTLEILLASAALRDVVPAVATAGIATVVAWPVVTDRPTYHVSGLHFATPVLAFGLILGPVLGLLGLGFVRLMNAARMRAPSGGRSAFAVAVAFTALGALAIAYPALLGNGKGPAQLAFGGGMSVGLAGALLLLKPLATAGCLASGAIGGLLTPALATGAVLGVVLGSGWGVLWGGGSTAEYAVVAAAAFLAVTQRGPLTAIALTLEFLHSGVALIPAMVLAVGSAVLTARRLDPSLSPAILNAVRRSSGQRPRLAA